MPGSFSLSPPDPNLGGQAVQVGVFFFDPNSGYSLIPNVFVTDIQDKEGHEPTSARFMYILDDRAAAMGFPYQFEDLWPLNSPDPNDVGQYIVAPGDRIAVIAQFGDGSTDVLFDGFARMPQVDVTGRSQAVTFSAVDVSFRCWDVIIKGAIYRNGDPKNIQVTDGTQDVQTTLPTRFNPAGARNPTGQPNCSPDNYDTGQSDASTAYPVFVDQNIDRPNNTDQAPRLWTLSGACRYLLSIYNPPDDSGSDTWDQQDEEDITGDPEDTDEADPTYQQFVTNPDFSALTDLLDSRQPKQGSQYFDPSDPSTYDSNPIVIRDFDATNMAWPDAMERLLGYYGFGMRWVLGQDGQGYPTHNLDIYRKDAANPDSPKVAYMQTEGDTLDPSLSNVEHLAASFDYHGVANEFIVETHPNRYEISVVLAPLFTVTQGDSDSHTRTMFELTSLATADDATRRAYRWYGVDECGDGHWDFGQKQMVTDKPFDFSKVWPETTANDGSGDKSPGYVVRFRPGRRDCLTDDGNGDVYHAQLALSRDYAGECPAIFDGTGTWQPINSDWALLEDRLGIEFTADSPEKINAGKWTDRGSQNVQNSGSVLKGIKSIADPGSNTKTDTRFYLRLTTVVDADRGIEAVASRRDASPIANVIQRRIDAKDHYRKDSIDISSAFYSEEQAAQPNVTVDPNTSALIPRDDTKAATAHAAQMRTTHEFPRLPVAITIPGVCLSYQIGDRISQIDGRDVSLQTNSGTNNGEAAFYPFIIARAFTFEGESQRTVLQLSDRRMEPQPIEHRRGR